MICSMMSLPIGCPLLSFAIQSPPFSLRAEDGFQQRHEPTAARTSRVEFRVVDRELEPQCARMMDQRCDELHEPIHGRATGFWRIDSRHLARVDYVGVQVNPEAS